MVKHFLKKSDVLREGYVKGLKKAQKIIREMLENADDDEELTDEVSVLADNEQDAIYYAECDKQCDIESYEEIEFSEYDTETLAVIKGIVWGEKWKR
mgnify:CR=1 FL=1